MTDPGDLAERFARLETKIALTEHLVDELNLTVYRQQQQIERLQRQIAHLHRQLEASSRSEHRDPRDEIPPHY